MSNKTHELGKDSWDHEMETNAMSTDDPNRGDDANFREAQKILLMPDMERGKALIDKLESLRKRIAVLEEVLRFYADETNYQEGNVREAWVIYENGQRARAALNPPTP